MKSQILTLMPVIVLYCCFNGIFLYFSLGCPAVVVAVSLAVTRAKGYGSSGTCWLDVDSGLIWAFIGPAVLVILVSKITVLKDI